ncbi:polar amino acid transport system permease protein [Rhodococcus rhodochrous J38]|jgi:polar amino acid transport system permease protein|uniref:amino acid ABC transporter permease n=1 Tax=Rhodococcus rhodochrous TaxID=1829 RepID=UPI0011AD24F7|nr:amino acid ABC transporter permease [Rhodococcus rhodochrous]TWH41968.1 polar amino acid transport system permease protein [Rhodococcus rhodochrous J38]
MHATTQVDPRSDTQRRPALEIAQPRNIGRNLAAGALVIVLGLFIYSLSRKEVMEWPMVSEYLFAPEVLEGLLMTLELTALSMGIALVLAVVLAMMRLSTNPVIRGAAWLYVWFFRGVPLLVLLIIFFNFALIYPSLSIGVPGWFGIGNVGTTELISPFWAAIAAFALHQAAYTSEVVRASVLAIPAGQTAAAASLGMTPLRTMRRIILPQATKVAVPPIANDTINMLKATAMVSYIAVYDLFYTVQQIYAVNFAVIPLLLVATIWYLVVVSVLSAGQWYLERRLTPERPTAGRGSGMREWFPQIGNLVKQGGSAA